MPNPVDSKAIKTGLAMRGWTQRDLARASGLPYRRVQAIAQGDATPEPRELHDIWRALSAQRTPPRGGDAA